MKGDSQSNADADVGQTPEPGSQLPFDKGMLEVKALNMLFSNVNYFLRFTILSLNSLCTTRNECSM